MRVSVVLLLLVTAPLLFPGGTGECFGAGSSGP